MSRFVPGLIATAVLAVLATGFAVLNGGERVTVRVGLLTFPSVSLPVVVFVAIVLGMLIVFLGGLKADLRSRRMLRRYRAALGADQWSGGPAGGTAEEL